MIYHRLKDQNPLEFIYLKSTQYKPEVILDISNLLAFTKQGIFKFEREFQDYLDEKDKKESRIVYFPKWIEKKYSELFILEKLGPKYIKYKVSLSIPEIDYMNITR